MFVGTSRQRAPKSVDLCAHRLNRSRDVVLDGVDSGRNGVPRYIVQGTHLIDGCKETAAYLETFQKIKKEEALKQ